MRRLALRLVFLWAILGGASGCDTYAQMLASNAATAVVNGLAATVTNALTSALGDLLGLDGDDTDAG